MSFTNPVSPVNERFELGSAAWVEAIQQFFDQQDLPHVDCSVGSIWHDCPPHLGFTGGAGGWSVRFHDGRADVARGPINPEQLDFHMEGDYNACAILATAVYGDDPAIGARAERESRHRAGNRHPAGRGSIPEGLSAVMHALHDHLARRTIDNVDIRHRIHHMGLDRNAEELAENGYTILERAVSEAMADEIAADIHRVHDENPGAPGVRANMLLERGRMFEEAAQHPWVMTLVEHLIGRGCLMYQSNCIRKEQGVETHQLHADYVGVPEPFPHYPVEVTSVWALEDWTREAGPTVFVPGTFRERRRPTAKDNPEQAIPLLMPKGSIALWDGATWHSASPRSKPGTRVSLHNAYCRFEMRSLEHYLEMDPAIVQRNPPRFSAMCGLDDFYSRNKHTGPDFNLLRAVTLAGYGSRELPPALSLGK